jgi:hypothetical protein
MALVMPMPTVLSARVDSRSESAAGQDEGLQSGRSMGIGILGVTAFSAFAPLIGLWRVAAYPINMTPVRYAVAVAATVSYLPLHMWLVASAARNLRPRGRWWAVAAEAAVIIGVLPFVGSDLRKSTLRVGLS